MDNRALTQGTAIILAAALVFIVQITPLSNYSSYLLALLIIFFSIYIALKKRSKNALELFTGEPVEIISMTSIILLIIVITGSIISPLFFFLYFLIFLFAFIARSSTVWFFVISVLLFFLPQAVNSPTLDTFVKLGSLLLISPIAYFVGKEIDRRNILSERIEEKTDEIIAEAESLKDSNTPPEQAEALDEIIEEAESLKQDAS